MYSSSVERARLLLALAAYAPSGISGEINGNMQQVEILLNERFT